MQINNYLLLFAVLVIFSPGCKKDKKDEPKCRISKLINRLGKEIRVIYNADGKYAKIENDYVGETVTTTYNANSIVITRVNNGTGTLKSKSTLLLNSSGMISTQKDDYYNTSGSKVTGTVKNEFEYNGSELIKSTETDSFHYQQSVSTRIANCNWNGGNLISLVSGTYLQKYEYYTDKLFQQADMESINRIIRGYDINLLIRNKNLTKSVSFLQYSYEYDAEGKIKATKYNGTNDYLVEYECN